MKNNLIDVLRKYGQETVMLMARVLHETRSLKDQIKTEVRVDKDGIELNMIMPYHAQFVDSGRRAGAKMPPIEPIKDWAEGKGIKQFRNDKGRFISHESRAFLIARKIARDGIKPRPFIHIFHDRINELKKDMGAVLAAEAVIMLSVLFEEKGIENKVR